MASLSSQKFWTCPNPLTPSPGICMASEPGMSAQSHFSCPRQRLVRATAIEETIVSDFTTQPHFPSISFRPLPAYHVECHRDYSGDNSSAVQNLSSFKGWKQPILYKDIGGAIEVLTNRAQDDSSIGEFYMRRGARDSRKEPWKNPAHSSFGGSPKNRPTPNNEVSKQCTSEHDILKLNFTTLMLRNLPRRTTQERLARVVDDLGFHGMYNLVYMPAENNNNAYGFVNFFTVPAARSFFFAFNNCQYPGRMSSNAKKRPCAELAKVQGLAATLDLIHAGNNFKKRGHVPLLFEDMSDKMTLDEVGVGKGGAFM